MSFLFRTLLPLDSGLLAQPAYWYQASGTALRVCQTRQYCEYVDFR